jgi:hypothetical protein
MGIFWTCVLVGVVGVVVTELCWITVKLDYLAEIKDVLVKIGDTLETIQENTRLR